MTKYAVALGIVGVLIGLLVGYLMWGRPARSLNKELAEAKAGVVEQTQRADAVQGKLAETESELKRAMEGLKSERDLREKYQELVSEGRK